MSLLFFFVFIINDLEVVLIVRVLVSERKVIYGFIFGGFFFCFITSG